jgi:hypothetical protein
MKKAIKVSALSLFVAAVLAWSQSTPQPAKEAHAKLHSGYHGRVRP